jgi:hypothetical protein
MKNVPLPPSLDAQAALDFAAGLGAYASDPMITIDFGLVRNLEPFGVLYTGAALRTFFRQREYRGIAAHGVRAGEPAHEYLAHIGFFRWLGISVGNAPGAVAGGATWLPVTTLTRAEMDRRIAETGKPLGSTIHEECDRLARLVTQSNQLKITGPLAYCLREVIRNVFEHAETDRCVLCAQKCADNVIEIAVIDQGRGIRRSLEERLKITSDGEALRNAIRPGVSRCPSSDPDNPWGNSGFGLFVLSEIGRQLGTFRVVSGLAVLNLTNGETREETTAFCGTAIQLRLRRPKSVNFASYIESIIARGESESSTANSSAPRASKSTKNIG